MTHGALPALGTRCRGPLLGLMALTLVATACSDQKADKDNFLGVPAFAMPGNEPPNESVPARVTGGGRIDFPPGGPEKNKRPAQDKYQTFSFHVVDRNNDGVPDANSQLEFTDHRENARVGNSPRRLKAIAFATFVGSGPDSECPDGRVTATGTADLLNTPTQEALQFTLRACDVDEPGNKFPNDWFELAVPGLGPDPDTGESYRMHFHNPFGSETQGAYLTGGNIQVKLL